MSEAGCGPFEMQEALTLLRKLVKQLQGIQEDINNNKYAECVQRCDTALTVDPSNEAINRDVNRRLCLCASKSDGLRGVKVCSKLLQLEPENSECLINRAEAHILNEEYDDGEKQSKANLKVGRSSMGNIVFFYCCSCPRFPRSNEARW